jgi:hypothetical protein
MTTDLAHCASCLCSVPADRAFAYLSAPAHLGEWALGCWEAAEEADGVVRGTSLFDGAQTFARAVAHPELGIVDFEVGDSPGELVRRITARVVPGNDLGEGHSVSLLLLTAWRGGSMDDRRWHRLVVAHETEVLLLRHRIEAFEP